LDNLCNVIGQTSGQCTNPKKIKEALQSKVTALGKSLFTYPMVNNIKDKSNPVFQNHNKLHDDYKRLKYDYMNNKYETVHPDAKMQMNPYTGDFQYVNPGAKPEMNWSTGDFEYPQQ
jgi:dsRNA-specific ribonuclease